MRLNYFILTLTVIYALVASGGFFLYRVQVIYPQLLTHTLTTQQNDVNALSRAFSAEKEHLRLLLIDWAKWDDLYWFVDNKNNEFHQSNLMPETFTDANLSAAYITTLDKDLIFGLEHPYKADFTIPASNESPDYKIISTLEFPEDDDSNCGYTMLASALTLYCIASAQDSNEENVGNGYLIFTREASYEFMENIKTITNTQFDVSASVENISDVLSMSQPYTIKHPKNEYFLGLDDGHNGYEFIIKLLYNPQSLPKLIDIQTYFLLFGLLFLPVVIFLGMRYFLIKPLANMSTFIIDMKEKNEASEPKDFTFIFEIKIFHKAVCELMEHMKDEKKYLQKLSLTDALTGISNRRAFDTEIQSLWKEASRYKKPIIIIMADIDFFKLYNDTHGHPMGDKAIQTIALVLKGICRRESDRVYRYGGEEFTITMTLDSESDLETVLNLIQCAVSDVKLEHPSSPISKYMTISLGACLISSPNLWMNKLSPHHAITIADIALYQAKKNGRNQFAYQELIEP